MKKVLGLDLGVASIGWALVNQAENSDEKSSIIKIGVRVNPLTTDEKDSFNQGKEVTTNAKRRRCRSARRNLQRYHLRRENLISILKANGWITDSTLLSENGNKSTFETYRLRAEAVEKEISLEEFSRVLLMINKKRGYKSNRKAKGNESGVFLDSIDISKELYENQQTPAEYSLILIQRGIKHLPDFYPSDLKNELNKIWTKQQEFYPNILTDDFFIKISNRSAKEVSKLFLAIFNVYTADNKGKNKKEQGLLWRIKALNEKVEQEVLAFVISDLCGRIYSSSGYLGDISDRSKELYINKITVGQFLYSNLRTNPHFSTKNIVFYRSDYLDEFEKIWEKQKQFHKDLTPELKSEIRDVVIFFQRRLKSQKWLISNCEFEKNRKVTPKSSILFQEFKIWQTLNNVLLTNTCTGEVRPLYLEEKQILSNELRFKRSISSKSLIEYIINDVRERREYELNFREIQGNLTLETIFARLLEIVNIINEKDNRIEKLSAKQITNEISSVFKKNGFNENVLIYKTDLPKEEYEKQTLFKLWHLLYSYENDNSASGDRSLIEKISELLNMPKEKARILSTITFVNDYGSLSHHAISKILPFLKQGYQYSEACKMAGYNHSIDSLTREEIENKILLPHLDNIPKNGLRNPVVEKILNQMINVVNSLDKEYGKPDEIHLEMCRELKQNQKRRKLTSEANKESEKKNAEIVEILKKEPFNLSYVSKSDITRYKLYEELKQNGYKTLYSYKYINKEKLFTREIDIEHIIPQSLMFNDSFNNKTLEYRAVNQAKDKTTAYDFVQSEYGDTELKNFEERVKMLYREKSISKAKRDFLLMREQDIPEDFLNRDLTNSQYIAKQAKDILEKYVRVVVPTMGGITARLREDWQLVDVMKELNMPKYEKANLVENIIDKDGRELKKIKNWSKRDDHRHHAMDALTIAFTKPSFIQYLNNLNARSNKNSVIYAIEQKETSLKSNGNSKKRIFNPPMPIDELREAFKDELESVLVSIKAKNKVATTNTNITKKKDGFNENAQFTPRGQLHKEQIYGLRKRYITYYLPLRKLSSENVNKVASLAERKVLSHRLERFGWDPKKAFTGVNAIERNPLWVDSNHTRKIGDKVKCVDFEIGYSIRTQIDKDLSVSKVMDVKCRRILEDRLKEYGGDAKKAFSNFESSPIWYNKEKGIKLKSVAIFESFNLHSLHIKKDKDGNILTDPNGQPIMTDFVELRNNHHVAIYKNPKGGLEESVVSFYEALKRKVKGEPIVNKEWKKDQGFQFLYSMKKNEMFVFPNEETDFDPTKVDLKNPNNYKLLSPNLYRVQKLASKDYWFRHHTATSLVDDNKLKDIAWKRVNINSLRGVVKVRINHIGKIVSIGEYD